MFGRVKVKIKEIVNEVWELERVGEGVKLTEGQRLEVLKRELASSEIAQETSSRHISKCSVEVDGRVHMRGVGVEAQLLGSMSVYSLRR